MSEMKIERLVEKIVEVRRYSREDPKPNFAAEVVPFDWKAAMRDLATRIETLQKASAKVLVSVDSDWLTLRTAILVEAPPPPPPPKLKEMTAEQLEREGIRVV